MDGENFKARCRAPLHQVDGAAGEVPLKQVDPRATRDAPEVLTYQPDRAALAEVMLGLMPRHEAALWPGVQLPTLATGSPSAVPVLRHAGESTAPGRGWQLEAVP